LRMLLLLLAPLTLVSAAPGSSKCTWGPSYWCANIPQASECSAVKHCIKAVWEKETVPQDDDEVCKICKEMVGEARDTLMSNETQEELREVFDGSCDLIPVGLIAKECKALVEQFVPELVETLASEMNPDTVCTVSGLCNSARIDNLLKEQRSHRHTGGDCLVCREGAEATKAQLVGETQNQVEDRLLELCGYFGSFTDACRVAVVERADQLYAFITSQPWEEGVCDLAGVCSEAFDDVPATQLQSGEDIQCEFCEKVIKHWVDVYASNASLAEFKQLLDGICEKLDKSNADHCKHVVDDYYIPAFNFLRHEVDPHLLCSLVGLCRDQPRLPAASVQQVALVPATKLTASSSQCEICQFAATELFSILEDPYDQRMVKNVLESICYRLPNSVERRCEQFVEGYTAKILDLITSGLGPDQLCLALNVCPGTQEEVAPVVDEEETVGDQCVICEYVVSTLDKMVTDKTNEAEIQAALDAMCSYMPKSISAQCTTFVDTYTEMIIDMLTKDVTPEMICSNLGLCSEDFEQYPTGLVEVESIQVGGPKVGGAYCTLCEVVVTSLDSSIQDKTNEAEIKQALDVLCYGLSTPVHKECIKLVSQYTDELVDMIVHEYPPNVICAELGLCVDHEIASNAIPPVSFEMVQVEAPLDNSVSCEMCEFAVTVIDERLDDEATIDQIEREVQFVCSYLPGTIGDKCEELVDKYGEKLIDALVKEEMDPKKVCTELIPSCATAKSAKQLCVWGPEMWCASPFHARMCGASALCGF